jgi:hypothetical protein
VLIEPSVRIFTTQHVLVHARRKRADRNGDFSKIVYLANSAYVIPLLAVVLLVFGKPRVLFGLACLAIVAVVPHEVVTELLAAMKTGGNPIFLGALGLAKTEPGWLDLVTTGDFLIMAASVGLILQGVSEATGMTLKDTRPEKAARSPISNPGRVRNGGRSRTRPLRKQDQGEM